MPTYYGTIAEAHNKARLDFGFDPFQHPKRRVTKAALAKMGYVVDLRLAAQTETPVAQAASRLQEKIFSYQCDAGHKWRATDAEDRAAGHKCPVCGRYWV